jgi:hypothetical protein
MLWLGCMLALPSPETGSVFGEQQHALVGKQARTRPRRTHPQTSVPDCCSFPSFVPPDSADWDIDDISYSVDNWCMLGGQAIRGMGRTIIQQEDMLPVS